MMDKNDIKMEISEETQLKTPVELLTKIDCKVGAIDIVFENYLDSREIIKKLEKTKYLFNYYSFTEVSISNVSVNYINEYTFKNVFSLRTFIYVYSYNKCKYNNAVNISKNGINAKFIKKTLSTLLGLKLLSNYNSLNNISVKTSSFFNKQGYDCFLGGAERYLIDLHNIFYNQNINMNIYQIADKPFFRKYNGVNVIGLYCENLDKSGNNYEYADMLTKNYIYRTYSNTQLHIYSSFQECYPNHIGPSIGICHGISWDSKNNVYSYGKDYFWENKRNYIDSAYYCDELISVDTNTPNWFQTVDFGLGNQKFKTIYNYVDTDVFAPKRNTVNNKNIVICFPRRLCEPRGLYLVLDIVGDVLKKYDNVEFHFVGRGSAEDTLKVDDLISIFPDKIKRYSMPADKMAAVYQNADISLIPTIYSEGTSLSCLEAMACGNIVIASRIGGITDLIISRFNGYLIEPNEKELRDTLFYVLDHFDDLSDIRENAVNVSSAFNKNIWVNSWEKELLSYKLKDKSENNGLVEFYVLNTDSIKPKMLNIIKQYLSDGYLVYIRTEEEIKHDNISNGLLQLLNADEEIVSKADFVFVDSSYGRKIVRDEELTYI